VPLIPVLKLLENEIVKLLFVAFGSSPQAYTRTPRSFQPVAEYNQLFGSDSGPIYKVIGLVLLVCAPLEVISIIRAGFVQPTPSDQYANENGPSLVVMSFMPPIGHIWTPVTGSTWGDFVARLIGVIPNPRLAHFLRSTGTGHGYDCPIPMVSVVKAKVAVSKALLTLR
jgi:hypothetical protein